ncbi:MAG: hypothetical protein JSV80_01940 [Acidobacteriota bacterium]|nr:MAG: hypothetical protein JSV80_01940 [Acidobacteriota bacterium]
MPAYACPSCGAPFDGEQPDPLARCRSCSSLLAVDPQRRRPLEARPRLDVASARRAVGSALAERGARWRPGAGELVFYPFAQTGQARRPLLPLACLPPAIERGWRASGADFVVAAHAADETDIEQQAAEVVRVPPSLGTPPDRAVAYYPFVHVVLSRADAGSAAPSAAHPAHHSAAWCDAVDGQVMFPEDLQPPAASSPSGLMPKDALQRWWVCSLAAGLAGGLLLPSPMAPAGLLIAAAALWRLAAAR